MSYRFKRFPLPERKIENYNRVEFALILYSVTQGTSTRTGLPYVTCRAFLSQGKDPVSGALRPSKWYALKAFCTPEKPNNLAVYRLLELQNTQNVRVHLTGKVEYREWSSNGRSGSEDSIIVEEVIETSLDPEPTLDEVFAGEPD